MSLESKFLCQNPDIGVTASFLCYFLHVGFWEYVFGHAKITVTILYCWLYLIKLEVKYIMKILLRAHRMTKYVGKIGCFEIYSNFWEKRKKIFRVTFNPLTEYSVITLQICALVRACSFFLLFSCIHVRFFAINFISFKIQLSAVEYFWTLTTAVKYSFCLTVG